MSSSEPGFNAKSPDGGYTTDGLVDRGEYGRPGRQGLGDSRFQGAKGWKWQVQRGEGGKNQGLKRKWLLSSANRFGYANIRVGA